MSVYFHKHKEQFRMLPSHTMDSNYLWEAGLGGWVRYLLLYMLQNQSVSLRTLLLHLNALLYFPKFLE